MWVLTSFYHLSCGMSRDGLGWQGIVIPKSSLRIKGIGLPHGRKEPDVDEGMALPQGLEPRVAV